MHVLDTRTLVVLFAVVSPLGLSCNGLMVGDAALCIYDRDWEGRLKLLGRLAMVLDDFLYKLLDNFSARLCCKADMDCCHCCPIRYRSINDWKQLNLHDKTLEENS